MMSGNATRLTRTYKAIAVGVANSSPSSEFNYVNLGLPMPRILSLILSILISANAICATANQAEPAASSPQVVLEATNTTRGTGGYKAELLLVRLTDDGKVEWDNVGGWDKLEGQYTRERQISTVSAGVVSKIKRTLTTVDESRIRSKMGPYYIYTDTTAELQIRMIAGPGSVTFTVLNPWQGYVQKPMPKDIKTVVCEISRLHAQVANTPVDEMCLARNKSR
jgi:hypothetical protein